MNLETRTKIYSQLEKRLIRTRIIHIYKMTARLRVRKILKKLESDHAEGLTSAEMFLATEDLLPVKEEQKTWDGWNFVSLLTRAIELLTDNIVTGFFLDS